MADQNITELPVKTSSGMTSSDYMLGIDSAEGYQMLIKDLGDYIIRNVQVNTIAGANQTLKSALDTLNSNLATLDGKTVIGNLYGITDLNNVRTQCMLVIASNTDAKYIQNIPESSAGVLICMPGAGDSGDFTKPWAFALQIFIAYTGNMYLRRLSSDGDSSFVPYAWKSITFS